MQLNLFEDNRTILLNCLDESLQQLDFENARILLSQIGEEYPEEGVLPSLNMLVETWDALLGAPDLDWLNPEHLSQLWEKTQTIQHEPFKKGLQAAVTDSLSSLLNPHQIYLPPDFHIGRLLISNRRFREALPYLQAALEVKTVPAGLICTWYGNTLIQLKQIQTGVYWNLAACLTNPANALIARPEGDDMASLLTSLQYEFEEDLTSEEELAWLPVWAVIKGMVPLPLADDNPLMLQINDLPREDDAGWSEILVQQRWFLLLLKAEHQRRHAENSIETRRVMKELNKNMFDLYRECLKAQS